MAIFVSPGVYIVEKDSSLYVRNESTTVCGMVITAPRGPVNEPVLITSVNAFTNTFGSPHPNHLGMYSAMEYLRYGRQLWVVRVNGSTAAVATISLNGVATYASLLSSKKGPFTVTGATSAALTGTDTAATVDITATNKFLKVQVNGGPLVTITLTENTGVTKATIAGEIDAALASYGADCSVVGTNQIKINSTATGVSTSVVLYSVANDIYTDLGFTLVSGKLSASGTDANNSFLAYTYASGVEDSQAVTLTTGSRTVDQLVTELNSAFTGGSFNAVADNYDGKLRITQLSIGQNYGLKMDGVTAATLLCDSLLGFVGESTVYGRGLSPASATMAVSAINEGEWGNLLSVVVAAGSVADTFKITVYEDGAAVEMFDNLVSTSGLEDSDLGTKYFLTAINGSGGVSISKFIEVSDTLTNTGFPISGTYALAGGIDGLDSLSDDDFIGTVSGNVRTGLQVFGDAEMIDVNLILCPGIHAASVINEMIAICESRGDCMALVDPPLGLGVQQVADWHNGAGAYSDHSAFNSSYAALYWPWLQTYDAAYDRYVWTPPSGHVAAVYAYSDSVSDVWIAAAGLNRGRVLQVTKLEMNANQGDRDYLYGGSNAVNPIANFVRDGIVVWGQKTLQRKPTALDRVNVRRMMLYLRKVVASSVRQLVFEPNDPTTWRTFIALVDPFMRSLVAGRGVVAYSVKCDETTNTPDHIDNNEMVANIYIQPTKSAEKIIVNAVLTPTGANFEETIL